jgi:hypothetical protein
MNKHVIWVAREGGIFLQTGLDRFPKSARGGRRIG